ncbi:hypothetical protein ACTWP5_07760 [Streptomyces sp. 4N509B]|uniref:hypothetical protein n=1 Tax=Streptomyces sp. 4N509B TaxID=3457413 RepID=UPI003FD4DF00
MTSPSEPGAAPTWRRRLTDPLVPVLALSGVALLAVVYAPLLTWAITGGLAGYSLSGSV